MGARVNAGATDHAVASAHNGVTTGDGFFQDGWVGDARLLASAATGASVVVDGNRHHACLPQHLVEAAQRTQRPAPYAPAPEELDQHDCAQGHYACCSAEQDAAVHGSHRRQSLEHRQRDRRRHDQHDQGDPHLCMARNRALGHRHPRLLPEPVRPFKQQVDRTDPPGRRRVPR